MELERVTQHIFGRKKLKNYFMCKSNVIRTVNLFYRHKTTWKNIDTETAIYTSTFFSIKSCYCILKLVLLKSFCSFTAQNHLIHPNHWTLNNDYQGNSRGGDTAHRATPPLFPHLLRPCKSAMSIRCMEAAASGVVLSKKLFLKILLNSQSLFFDKIADLSLHLTSKKETLGQVFFCEFCNILGTPHRASPGSCF